jgi:hypothetical protein
VDIAWWNNIKSLTPERAKETNGAIPVPVAMKTGALPEGLNVKYP